MAPAFKLDEPPTETGALIEITPQTTLAVFTDRAKYSDFYARMKAETDKFVPDLTTAKGRAAIASEARKVVTAKTTLEKAGKALVEEWRDKTKAVTSARIEMVNELDALAKEVRRPLTEWEDAEKARVAQCRAVIDGFREAQVISLDDTAADVRARGMAAYETELDANLFGDLLGEAERAKTDAVATLHRAMGRLEKEEADRAELERLRAENEAREAREAEARAAREEAERKAEEARQAEDRRAAAEKAEAERIARAKEEAATAAREEAERARQSEIDAANERARKAEQESQAERDRIARVEKARKDAEAAEIAAQAERDENKAHRTKVKAAAKVALMSCGADEDTARKIVMAIIAGEVPNVTLRF